MRTAIKIAAAASAAILATAATSALAITTNLMNQAVAPGVFSNITGPAGVSPATIPAPGAFASNPAATLAIPGGNAAIWVRYDFLLPANFDPNSIFMNVVLSVDNEVQMFLNGMNAAVEDDTATQNFTAPFPEFILNPDNTTTDVSGTWDALPISQSMFQAGLNTVHFFATNNGGPGHFRLINGTVDYNLGGNPNPIPVPAGLVLLGSVVGLGGWAARRKRRS